MKTRRSKSISESLSSKNVPFLKQRQEDSVVGGWSGMQRSASRSLSAAAYVRQVRKALENSTLPGGSNAFHEFAKLVDQLRTTEKSSHNNKMATIEQLIGLLEDHPLLILNLTIFLPDEYQIEIQRDAVIVKIFETEQSLNFVDTGHSRSIDNTPHSAWAWLGQSGNLRSLETSQLQTSGTGTLSVQNKRLSERTRIKSASPGRTGSLPTSPKLNSNTMRKNSKSRLRSSSQNLLNTTLRQTEGPQGRKTGMGDSQIVDRSCIYLAEGNMSSTDVSTLKYIREIKKLYVNHPQVYRRFTEVLTNLHSGTLEDLSAIAEIVTLFKNRPALVLGLNSFLPKDCSIVLIESNTTDESNATPKYAFEVFDENRQIVRHEIINT